MANYFLNNDGSVSTKKKTTSNNYRLGEDGKVSLMTTTASSQSNDLDSYRKRKKELENQLLNYKRKEANPWWDKNDNVVENVGNVFYKLFGEKQEDKYKKDERYDALEKEYADVTKKIEDYLVENKTYDNSILSYVEKSADVTAGNIRTSIDGINSTILKATGQEPVVYDSYEEKLANKILSQSKGAEKVGLEITGSMARMIPQIIMPTKTTSFITGFANYGGGAYNQAKKEGYAEDKATLYGITIGGLETGLQSLLGGFESVYGKSVLNRVTNKIMRKVISNPTLRNYIAKVGGEFTEEYLQEFLNPIVRNVILEEENGADFWNQAGMENKIKQFAKNFFNEQNLYAGVLGGLTSGIMDSPALFVNNQTSSTSNSTKPTVPTVQEVVAQEKNSATVLHENNPGLNTSKTDSSTSSFNKEVIFPTSDASIASNKTSETDGTLASSIANNNTNNIKNQDNLNIKKYTDNDINRFLTGDNLIDGINAKLNSFVEKYYDPITKKAKEHSVPTKTQKMFLGRINDNLAGKLNTLLNNSKMIQKQIGKKYDTTDTNIVISSNNIEHSYNDHGIEKRPGQMDVTPESLSKYGEVVSNPDYIGLSSQLSRGNTPTFYFTKKINGYSVAVEVLSTKKQLYPESYYVFKSDSKEYLDFIKNNKLKKAEDVVSNDIMSDDINARGDTSVAFSNNNIPQVDKNVKLPVISNNNTQNVENNTNNINSLEKTAPPMKRTDKNQLGYIPKDPTKESSYDVPEKITRKQVRQKLLNEMNITTHDLSKGNDLISINYQLTDPIRVNEKVFGKILGDKINEVTIRKTKHNTAEKTRWLNKERSEIKELGIKARSKESAAVQKYGEKQYINEYGEMVYYGDKELAKEFSNINTQNKIRNAAKFLRTKYDNYINQINDVITNLGYDPIPKRNDYMRHFKELGDVFSKTGVPFNLNDMNAENLPTDINGLTEFNKPGKNWFASAMERKGTKTTYDAITGIDGYLEGAGNLIFHTEDVQRYRALSSLIRDTFGQTKGWENLSNLTDTDLKQRIDDIQSNKLSKYVAWLDEQANSLAGKKGTIDRGVERALGRKAYTFFNTVKKQVGSNMTGFNVRSSLTNLISSTIASAKTNKIALVKGTISTINNMIKNDEFIYKSDFLTSRFGSDQLSPKLWQKISNAGQIFMNGTDYFTANQIVRSKYFEGLSQGMTETEAITYADDFAARVMGDRSQGATAEAFNSKTLGLFTQFQLEVNNQWQYMVHDTKMDYQQNSEKSNGLKAGATALFQLGQLAAYSYFFNELFEALTGSRAAFDPIEIIKTLFGIEDEEEKTFDKRLSEAGELLIDNIPFGNLITGGGRIPIAEAFTGISTLAKKLTNQTDSYGNEITWIDVKNDMLESLPYFLLPAGYGQIKKSVKGLKMYDTILPIAGSYTDSGNLRFNADESTVGKVKAFLFGQYSSKEAQKYIDSGYKTINVNRIQEMKDLGMSASEYREYRSGLTASGSTNKEKMDYISNLKGVSDNKKSIMASNVLGRKIDYSEYKKYKSYDEFNYSYNNPEKYQVITQITTYDKYLAYQDEIDNVKEKYTNSNQRKAEVIKHVNSLNLSIPQKAMLIKLNYSSYNSYNDKIIQYINKQNLTKQEKTVILTKLGFTVRNGRVYS